MPYLSFWLTVINLHRLEVWSGLEAFWRNSKREREGTIWSLDDSSYCLCSNWITSSWLIPFCPCIFSPSNNIKIENYPLTKSLKKDLGLIKVDRYTFSSLLLLEFKYFSWNFRIVKNWKQAKSMFRRNIPWKVCEVSNYKYKIGKFKV